MKNKTKLRITLSATDLELVNELMETLKAKSNADVISRGLALLKDATDRKSLRVSFRKASQATRANALIELSELS